MSVEISIEKKLDYNENYNKFKFNKKYKIIILKYKLLNKIDKKGKYLINTTKNMYSNLIKKDKSVKKENNIIICFFKFIDFYIYNLDIKIYIFLAELLMMLRKKIFLDIENLLEKIENEK